MSFSTLKNNTEIIHCSFGDWHFCGYAQSHVIRVFTVDTARNCWIGYESGVSAQPMLPGVKPASVRSLGIMRTLGAILGFKTWAFKSFENTGPGDADSAWVKVPAARLRPMQTSLLLYTGVLLLAEVHCGVVVPSSDLSLWDSISPNCICF